jgi:murein DD-endopeptidase MepM/ murein hydrolase activator NlpD
MLLTMAALLIIVGAASANVGDVTYGEWSAWTDQPIENQTNLFVEKRQVVRLIRREAWRYSRYTLSSAEGTQYVATEPDAPGAAYEEIELDAPLPVTEARDGHSVYQGEWFNQQALTLDDHSEAVTQYRSREIFLSACAIQPSAQVLMVGEHVQLGIEVLDSGAYSLTSDNPSVASVDQRGLLSALAPGRTCITLIYQGQTAVCEVLVVGERTAFDEGATALRLSGTRLTVRYDAGRKDVIGLKLQEEAEGSKSDPETRFLIDNVDGDTFSLRALCPRIAYLTAPLSDDGVAQPGEARVKMLWDIHDQKKRIDRKLAEKARLQASAMPTAAPETEDGSYAEFMDENGVCHRFRAIKTAEGSYILCLQADNTLALRARRSESGAGLSVEALNLDDPLERWTLEAEKRDVTKDTVWRLPIADNSFCEITDDFKTMARDKDVHDGVDFSPTGNKDVVAVMSGRVVRIDDRCTHDYAKTKLNKYGRYIDPCDEKDGIISKYGSYGKYVIVEHSDGTRSMYAHLSKILVRSGQKVKKGQRIAIMGSTGSSCGVHLHFEVRVSGKAADPRYYLDLPKIGGYVP